MSRIPILADSNVPVGTVLGISIAGRKVGLSSVRVTVGGTRQSKPRQAAGITVVKQEVER